MTKLLCPICNQTAVDGAVTACDDCRRQSTRRIQEVPVPTPANAKQEGGTHYAKHEALQHWDVVAHFGLDYFQGQITKYVLRWKDKGGVQDLRKAAHFLEKYIELQEKEGGKS